MAVATTSSPRTSPSLRRSGRRARSRPGGHKTRRQEILGADEVDAKAFLDRAQAEGDGQIRLAHAGQAEEQDVRRLGDEGECGEIADLALIDRGLKAKVDVGLGNPLDANLCVLAKLRRRMRPYRGCRPRKR
jgi:hypothetical protein